MMANNYKPKRKTKEYLNFIPGILTKNNINKKIDWRKQPKFNKRKRVSLKRIEIYRKENKSRNDHKSCLITEKKLFSNQL